MGSEELATGQWRELEERQISKQEN